MPSKLNPECSWWISIRSEKYTRLYSNLCKVLDRILAEEYWFIEDAGEAEFSVKTSDGKTIHKEISCGHDDVQKFFSTLKRMLPKDVTVL